MSRTTRAGWSRERPTEAIKLPTTRETKSSSVVLQRMLDKVEIVTESGCWIWMGANNGDQGYGVVHIGSKKFRAHRLMYELLLGQIPEGLVIDHLCRVRCCVNPAHMEPVTDRENILRGEAPGIKRIGADTCINGHIWSDARTRWYKGRRFCQECERLRASRRRGEWQPVQGPRE